MKIFLQCCQEIFGGWIIVFERLILLFLPVPGVYAVRIHLTQLIIMLLALTVSALPVFRLDQVENRKMEELTACQTSGETEFIPVNLEGEIQHPDNRPDTVIITQYPHPLPINPRSEHIILCKKACTSGQVCMVLPLRL